MQEPEFDSCYKKKIILKEDKVTIKVEISVRDVINMLKFSKHFKINSKLEKQLGNVVHTIIPASTWEVEADVQVY